MKPDFNESAITRYMCRQLEQAGAVCYALVGSEMQTSGLPDRYICHRRFQGFVEAKKYKAALTEIQRLRCDELVERGGCVLLVRYSWSSSEKTWMARFRTHCESIVGSNGIPLGTGCGTALVDEMSRIWFHAQNRGV